DARLADALLNIAEGYDIRRNEPYGPEDGVTHTLKRHALPRNLLNVMIEIRSDLIETPEECAAMADTLAAWLVKSLEPLSAPRLQEAQK
ncbi:MAG: N-formylglutamate amidohydrolase, partial [Pseudomonadota bacterium]